MTAEDRFARVLENLYRAALGEVGWGSTAALIDDMISAHGQSLVYGGRRPRRRPEVYLARFYVNADRREDLEKLYVGSYCWRDEAIPRLHGYRDGDLIHKSDLYTDREKRTSAAYNEFRRPHGTEDGLFMTLDGGDGCGIVWSCGNSTEREGWGHDQIQVIKRLGAHLRQFARVRFVMAKAEKLGRSLAELLETRQWGMIHLDRCGRILEANDRARDILLKRDGLRDARGVLAARNQRENAELQRLLARALPPYGAQGAGGWMKITRRRDRIPLVLDIHPVPMMDKGARSWEVVALVLVVDPTAKHLVDSGLVATVLGLTPTESRVAVALATGRSVAGIAQELNCAESTVRTHLKSVYRKQGIHKQTELVQRVLALGSIRQSI